MNDVWTSIRFDWILTSSVFVLVLSPVKGAVYLIEDVLYFNVGRNHDTKNIIYDGIAKLKRQFRILEPQRKINCYLIAQG